jgi:hypothetical protein
VRPVRLTTTEVKQLSKRTIALLFGALVLGLVAVGCGGGSDSGGEALTKAELIKQGDEICKQGESELEEETEKFAEENEVDTEAPTKAQQEEVIETVVAPALLRQAEEISGLGAPSGEEEAVEEILGSLEAGAKELEEEPALLLEGKNPVQKASKLAKEYGFEECGNE